MSGSVSSAARQRLREAMQRLLAGSPRHTDGKLTKNNLYREAQVSRATMNRAGDVLAEWDAQAGASPAAAATRRRDDELGRLRHALTTSRTRCRDLQDQVDAAATVIAALAAENVALRRQAANATTQVVVPLPERSR
jgi:methyl-accepting chemotaxis protein